MTNFNYDRRIKDVVGRKEEENKLFLGLKDRETGKEDSFLFVAPVKNIGKEDIGIYDLITGEYHGDDLHSSSSDSEEKVPIEYGASYFDFPNKFLYCTDPLDDRKKGLDEGEINISSEFIRSFAEEDDSDDDDNTFIVSDTYLDERFFGFPLIDVMEERNNVVVRMPVEDSLYFRDEMIGDGAVFLKSSIRDTVLPFSVVGDSYGYMSSGEPVKYENLKLDQLIKERRKLLFPKENLYFDCKEEPDVVLPFDTILKERVDTVKEIPSVPTGFYYNKNKIIYDQKQDYKILEDLFFTGVPQITDKKILDRMFSCLVYYRDKIYVAKEPLSVYSFVYDLKQDDERLDNKVNFLVMNVSAFRSVEYYCPSVIYLIPLSFQLDYCLVDECYDYPLEIPLETLKLLKSCFSSQRFSGYDVHYSYYGLKGVIDEEVMWFQVSSPHKEFWSIGYYVFFGTVKGRRIGFVEDCGCQWTDICDTIWLKFGAITACGVLKISIKIFIHYIP